VEVDFHTDPPQALAAALLMTGGPFQAWAVGAVCGPLSCSYVQTVGTIMERELCYSFELMVSLAPSKPRQLLLNPGI
jgi:hypothetical protein